MNNPCDAVWLYVAAIWSAATLASFQTAEAQTAQTSFEAFELSHEIDIDFAYAAGDLRGHGNDSVVDLRYRFKAERVGLDGQRWGARAGIAANTGDGRRGFSQTFGEGPQIGSQSQTGLATGWANTSQLDAGSGRIELTIAELYYKTGFLEWQIGWGPSAAVQTRDRALTALRLSRSDRAIADLVGGGLSHTGLSLGAPAPRVALQTRRIVGVSVAASFTPDPARCGVDICRPGNTSSVLSPDLSDLISVAATFDRRIPTTGVRWQASIGVERAQVQSALAQFENPWIVTGHMSRDHQGVTLGVSFLQSNDGIAQGRYRAFSGSVAFERENWLYSAEIAHGDSQLFDVRGASYGVGASRWVGDKTLISFGFIAHEVGGLGGVVETGLRF